MDFVSCLTVACWHRVKHFVNMLGDVCHNLGNGKRLAFYQNEKYEKGNGLDS